MQVYHGSYMVIDEIDLSKTHPNRDFGQGFYVTKFREQAESWAKNIGEKYGNKGCVTEFTYYDTEFTERLCKVKHFGAYNEEWLDFVVMNRNPFAQKPAHDYDIVEGPVADDKIQRTLQAYLAGRISKEQFLKMLSFHGQTHQICFCTMRSLLVLSKKPDDSVFDIENIAEKIVEQMKIEKDIDAIRAADMFYTPKTFAKLADKTTLFYKKDWNEIYKSLLNELNI